MAGARDAIVVGTDGSDTAVRAVDEAIRLAGLLGCELHIVSAYEPLRGAHVDGAPEGDVGAALADSKVSLILDEAAATARRGGVEVRSHAVSKDPADALLDVAKEVSATIIVVGSRGMHGARRLVLGSVPNTVSHKADCNVLIVATHVG